MTPPESSPIGVLDAPACWQELARHEVGRLAVAFAGVPEIFPVNFAVTDGALWFRTAEGSKLLAATIGVTAAFEVDRWDEAHGVSVVAHGTLRDLDDPDALADAAALPLRPWVGTIKTHYLRLAVEQISGRAFAFGAAPDEYDQLG